MYYIYLLESVASRRVRYVGHSDDLKQRLRDHNAGKNVSTALNRPWRLKTYLAFSAKPQALAFERYLKSGSGHAFANKRLWGGGNVPPGSC
jgi:putative endonuclease